MTVVVFGIIINGLAWYIIKEASDLDRTEVIVIGEGGGLLSTAGKKSCSAILVRTPAYRALFDCGYGTLGRMNILGISPTELTALFITHSHFDHIYDGPAVVMARDFIGKRDGLDLPPLDIYGPVGIERDFWGCQGILGAPGYKPNTRFFEDEKDFGSVITVKVEHYNGLQSIAIMLRDGCSVVCTGDLKNCEHNFEALQQLPGGAGLLITEATGQNNGHFDTAAALKLQELRRDRYMLLGHWRDSELAAATAAATAGGGRIVVAKDGLKFRI